jgi:metal-responsive CopG/Arc/MetJ family transcriptional regulator
MSTVAVSITIPLDLRDRLDAVAGHARVSRSWLLTTIATGWLDNLDAASVGGEPRAAVINSEIARCLDARS